MWRLHLIKIVSKAVELRKLHPGVRESVDQKSMLSHVGSVFLKQSSACMSSGISLWVVFVLYYYRSEFASRSFMQLSDEMTLDEALTVTSAIQQGATAELEH